jgi:hypothetical protein
LNDSIILLTENTILKNLSTEKISNSKIVSFDYKTHIELIKLGIKHEIVEQYFEPNDEKLIEKTVYEKFLKWHEQDWVSQYLYLDELNLGSLLDQFIGMYFLKIVKKFVCINRIIEHEKPTTIYASNDLTKIISKISKFDQIIVNPIPGKEQSLLYYDRIQIPIKIASKSFSIWISRKRFLQLKIFVEKLTINIFRLKPKLETKNPSKSILLLDFNILLDGDFIKDLSTLESEIILLHERKPAIWNIDSFKKIKNSQSKILRLQDLMNKQVELEILKIHKQIEDNLEKIKKISEFESFFSFEDETMWPIIKDEFIQMCSKYFREAIIRYKLSQMLFEKLNIKSLLILYPNAAEERVIIHVAHKFNIPGIVLQHGVPPHAKYYEKFLSLWYPSEQRHLIHAIWDKTEKKHLKTLGIKDENLVLTGSHRLDLLLPIKNECKNNDSILVASSTLAKQDEPLDSSTFTSIEYGEMLRDICTIGNNIPEKKLIVKLHPAQSPTFDAKMLIQEIDDSIPIYQHENILPFLKNCDVLVCMEYSTILLEAMILNKPTITSLVYSDWFEDDEMIQRGATLTVRTKEDFELALKKILNDTEFRNNLIKKGNEFVNDFLENQGQSVKSIKQLLENSKLE